MGAFHQFLRTVGRWQKGRQGTGYEKCLLLISYFPVPFDFYLLRYRKGQGIPFHKDPVLHSRHYRINVVIKKSTRGGAFLCHNPIWSGSRIHFFRSDLSEHAVEPVQEGVRYVLSLGWILPERKDQI